MIHIDDVRTSGRPRNGERVQILSENGTARAEVVLTEYEDADEVTADITLSTGVLQRDANTLMAAPLLARDQLLGVIYLECRSGRRGFRDDDRDILLGLANQVAIAIVASRAMRLELESALTRQRFEEQRSLLDAAVRMASGDLGSPIKVPEGSGYQHLAAALESMRRDLWTKLAMLETRTSEIQSLNEELRRQIEQRSRRLMSTIMQRQGGKAPAMQPLEPGKILVGRYRVHRQIGRGAMGAVYEVERTSDGKRLAAKLLSTRADKASLLRFTREAQIMSRLSHKNLIGIADIDMTAGGVLFIVLELVSGGSLLKLRHRYGDTRWALCVLRQISDALAAIHQAGIVHRDLKPGNVLIASAKETELPLVKLADFGVSLLTGEGSGPIALLSSRKPSSASLRGAVTPPPTPSVHSPSAPAEPVSGPSTRELYTPSGEAGEETSEQDDEADTDSVMKLDDADLGTASMIFAELKTTPRASQPGLARPSGRSGPPAIPGTSGPSSKPIVTVNPLARLSPTRPTSRPPPPPAGQVTMEMEAAVVPEAGATVPPVSLDPAEVRTPLPPSQVSLSAMLAAPEDSVVVSGMLTQADALIGTPMYMAPELSNTGSHRAEPLSDIFSLGVIAFELLTGRMPFAVPPVILRANDEPIIISRLSRIRPDLDPRLIALVESCLAINPESRLRASELTRRLIELGAPAPQG